MKIGYVISLFIKMSLELYLPNQMCKRVVKKCTIAQHSTRRLKITMNKQEKDERRGFFFFGVLSWKEQGVTSVKTHIFSCKGANTLHAK